jgi:hypothetical protein
MDIKMRIGTVAAGSAGCEMLPVYLREMDGDCGPQIQVGDYGEVVPEDFEFSTLEAFWTRWSRRFILFSGPPVVVADTPAGTLGGRGSKIMQWRDEVAAGKTKQGFVEWVLQTALEED